MEAPLLKVALHTVQKNLACLADTAAQHHHIGIHHAAKAGDELTHVGIDLLQHFLCQGIACTCSVKHILGNDLFHASEGRGGIAFGKCQLCQSCDTGSRAILLHAAMLAAAAGGCFVAVEHHVTDLAAGTCGAVYGLTVHDNAAADTGTQGDHDHGVTALSAALPAFAQCCHGSIVTGNHFESQQRLQSVLDAEVAPAQVDAACHNAMLIHSAGNTDTGTQDALFGNALFLHILVDRLCNIRQNVLAVFRGVGGDFPLVEHSACFVKVGQLHRGAAQVDTKSVFHFICTSSPC